MTDDETPDIDDSDLGCFVDPDEPMTECLVDGVFSAGPSPTLIGLVMSATVLTSFYIAGNGSIVTPAVILILLGPVLVALLPAQFVTLAYTLTAVGVAAIVFTLWMRYTSRGGF